MVPDETSDLPTTLPEASFLNPNRKVPSEARSLRGLFPVPVFAEFPSYSLSKNADGFLQNPFWLSYCNLRKLKEAGVLSQTGSDPAWNKYPEPAARGSLRRERNCGVHTTRPVSHRYRGSGRYLQYDKRIPR